MTVRPSAAVDEGGGAARGGNKSVVFATRIHLGNATTPPAAADLDAKIASFLRWAASCGASRAAVAVDPAPKIGGYDLVAEVRGAVGRYRRRISEEGGEEPGVGADGDSGVIFAVIEADVIPVAPWGAFVPALNALVAWAASSAGADLLLLASAETSVPPAAVEALCRHFDGDGGSEGTTLVAGAALPGHDYRGAGHEDGGERVELTGRTVPWNTLAVWSVPKLALTGFPLVADGLHPLNDDGTGGMGPAGVEERSAVALLQRVLSEKRAVAKLVRVGGVTWETDFGGDEGRREWHERKMRSKEERAARHGELLGLGGWVVHC